MERNHIHLAQGVAGTGVISGITFSFFFCFPPNPIYFVLIKACERPHRSSFSSIYKRHSMQASSFSCQVILTEGDSDGFLSPEFFERVENAKRKVMVQG